jgi:hypothetical protein
LRHGNLADANGIESAELNPVLLTTDGDLVSVDTLIVLCKTDEYRAID